jgi:hypothetical protein
MRCPVRRESGAVMQPQSWWPRTRYQWANAPGLWATAHQRWASMPFRRYVHRICTAAHRPLSVAYQGFPEGLTYVLPYLLDRQQAVAGPVTVSDRPLGTWRSLHRRAADADVDILVTGCSAGRAASLSQERTVVLPFRVRLLLEVQPDRDAMLARVSGDERRQFRKLHRKHEWEVEVGGEVGDLEFFYEHRPTMASRYGDEARSADWATALWCLFRNGVLLFVTEGGKRVAGALCRLDDGGATLGMRLLGVLDGDKTHYRSGAMKAVYYLTMDWAVRNGVTLLDFSGSDPFPGKGVFQFKRRFHPTVVLPADHYGGRRVLLDVVRDSAAVRDLLAATPMLVVDEGGQLAAEHFYDRDRPMRSDIRWTCPGVRDNRAIDLDEFFNNSRCTTRMRSR